MPKFFVTTPIYYVNARPHIGHVYTALAADVLARWRRRRGDAVLFSTGTDENSQKNVDAAREAGQDVRAFVDAMAAEWQATFKQLNLTYDTFIRTTSAAHRRAVEAVLQRVGEAGDIYRGEYEGLYCVGCEAFYAEKDLVESRCPIHRTLPERIKEQNYFFRLGQYKAALLKQYDEQPDFVAPESARNQLRHYVTHELADVSITRQSQAWGIRLPQDPTQAVYVWIDALINYLTVAGWPDDEDKFRTFWPADLHLIGKDIVKFHGVIWPALLLSAGLPLPRRIFAHGFFTVDGQKISKSLGNAIDPLALAQEYPLDALRYYLLADIPFGNDGDFSHVRLRERYNADLANGLGNLVSRVLTMFEQFWPDFSGGAGAPPEEAARLLTSVNQHLAALAFDQALAAIWRAIAALDGTVEAAQPWRLYKEGGGEELHTVLLLLYNGLVAVNDALAPFLPTTHEALTKLLSARPLRKPAASLFARKG